MRADTIPAPADTHTVRWIATVHYRTDSGIVDAVHDLEELSDLEPLVEAGPHWDTIDHINIVRSDRTYEAITVEEAAKL